MSITDDLMWRYYELLSDLSLEDIATLHKDVDRGNQHPMEVKKQLAGELTARFHDDAIAVQARNEFEALFKRKETPDEIAEVEVKAGEDGGLGLAAAMREAGLVNSNGDGMRMIRQNAVSIDGEKTTDTRKNLKIGERVLLKVGKRKFSYVTIIE
ncbi:MAG: hypothetical protein HQL71_15440 [Magnetococcales bacterium]|nr:hypothetical protein [Magnetococcales bacterium]